MPTLSTVTIDLKHMKKDIHPKYFKDAKAICACGNIIETGSTVKEIKIELCSKCHPFYTGKQKLVDSARRVEKFQTKMKSKSTKLVNKKAKKDALAKKRANKTIKLIDLVKKGDKEDTSLAKKGTKK